MEDNQNHAQCNVIILSNLSEEKSVDDTTLHHQTLA